MVSATCIFHAFATAVTEAEITPTSRDQQTRQIYTCIYLIKSPNLIPALIYVCSFVPVLAGPKCIVFKIFLLLSSSFTASKYVLCPSSAVGSYLKQCISLTYSAFSEVLACSDFN